MNVDLSVAPEIAQLAALAPVAPPPQACATIAPPTAGRAAGELARLAAEPQTWWDQVRFDPDGPVRIPLAGTGGAWLLVLPPGASAHCHCGYATLLAGEAIEVTRTAGAGAEGPAGPAAPLHAGRVRVHGRRAAHQVRGAGHGYSVSLHWGAAADNSQNLLSRTSGGVSPIHLWVYGGIITATDADYAGGRPDCKRFLRREERF